VFDTFAAIFSKLYKVVSGKALLTKAARCMSIGLYVLLVSFVLFAIEKNLPVWKTREILCWISQLAQRPHTKSI